MLRSFPFTASSAEPIDSSGICIVVTIFALLLTGLFVNGEAFGITPVTGGDAVEDAQFTANGAGDDGVTVSNDDETAYVYIESGNISIPSRYEGIEAINITIAGGVIDIRLADDGINANGWGGNSIIIRAAGGDITIVNGNGRDADRLDSNGSIEVSGGMPGMPYRRPPLFRLTR